MTGVQTCALPISGGGGQEERALPDHVPGGLMDEREVRLRCIEAASKAPMVQIKNTE